MVRLFVLPLCLAAACGSDARSPSADASSPPADAAVADATADAGTADAGLEVGLECSTRAGFTITRHHPDLHAVSSGLGIRVAAGDNGALFAWNDDGECHESTGNAYAATALYFDGDRFLAGQDFGHLLASSDGLSWTELASPDGLDSIVDLLRFGDQLLVVTNFVDGGVWTVDDGGTWTQRGSWPSAFLHAVAASPSRAVVVGEAGRFFTSSDGVTWTERDPGVSGRFQDVAYGPAGFVAVAALFDDGIAAHSADGLTWTATQIAGQPVQAVTYADGLYVAVGESGTVITSPDGQSWTAHDSGTTRDLGAVHHSGSHFVAVGADGVVVESADGVSFSVVRPGSSATLEDIAYGPPFVAVGSEGVLRSADGIEWQAIALEGNPGLTDVAHAGGLFVVAGSVGLERYVATSSDGLSWQRADSATGSGFAFDVAHGALGWMAVGTHLLRSDDGLSWSTGSIPGATGGLGHVAALGGTYVVTNHSAPEKEAYRSVDGETWSVSTFPEVSNFAGIGVTDSQLVIVDDYDSYWSPDGVSWTRRDISRERPVFDNIRAIASLGAQVVVLGSAGSVLSTSDGLTWRDQNLEIGFSLTGMAGDDEDRWVIIGENGLIMTAAAADAPL